jgi:ABC-type thiamin/hydroxymethylpyrimidine transport system permease subunit
LSTTTAPVISISCWTIDYLLFRKTIIQIVIYKVRRFNSSNSSESITWTTTFLTFNRCNTTFISPIKFQRKIWFIICIVRIIITTSGCWCISSLLTSIVWWIRRICLINKSWQYSVICVNSSIHVCISVIYLGYKMIGSIINNLISAILHNNYNTSRCILILISVGCLRC